MCMIASCCIKPSALRGGILLIQSLPELDAGDLVLQKVVAHEMALDRGEEMGGRLSYRELEQTAEQWRPWRAYAAMLLWRSTA